MSVRICWARNKLGMSGTFRRDSAWGDSCRHSTQSVLPRDFHLGSTHLGTSEPLFSGSSDGPESLVDRVSVQIDVCHFRHEGGSFWNVVCLGFQASHVTLATRGSHEGLVGWVKGGDAGIFLSAFGAACSKVHLR